MSVTISQYEGTTRPKTKSQQIDRVDKPPDILGKMVKSRLCLPLDVTHRSHPNLVVVAELVIAIFVSFVGVEIPT